MIGTRWWNHLPLLSNLMARVTCWRCQTSSKRCALDLETFYVQRPCRHGFGGAWEIWGSLLMHMPCRTLASFVMATSAALWIGINPLRRRQQQSVPYAATLRRELPGRQRGEPWLRQWNNQLGHQAGGLKTWVQRCISVNDGPLVRSFISHAGPLIMLGLWLSAPLQEVMET